MRNKNPIVRALLAEISKDKLRSDEGIAEQPVHRVSGLLKEVSAKINFQNKNGKHNLQSQPPDHRFLVESRVRLVEKA